MVTGAPYLHTDHLGIDEKSSWIVEFVYCGMCIRVFQVTVWEQVVTLFELRRNPSIIARYATGTVYDL